MELYIIRHGETDFNKRGIIQGRGVNSDLNDHGISQARSFYKAYHHIEFDKVITSTLKRTHQTVQSFIDVMIESVTATAIASNIAGKWTLETATSTTTSVSTQATWSTSRPRPTTVQTVKPSAIPTITPRNELVSIVTNGGNLRTEPKTTHDTVIGQVCPGDEVTLLEKDQIDSTAWYHVQLRRQSLDCDPNRVKVGTTGWISKSLLSKPSLSSIP